MPAHTLPKVGQSVQRRAWQASVVIALIAMLQAAAYSQTEGWSSGFPNLRVGSGAPPARVLESAVWTGSGLFVWGGYRVVNQSAADQNTGGVYDLATDTWQVRPNLASGNGAPSPRRQAVAAHHEGKIIVYGGEVPPNNGPPFANGGVYDLATDTWMNTPNLTNAVGAPQGRRQCVRFVYDERFYIFGGLTRMLAGPFGSWYDAGVFDGGVYDIATDTWVWAPGISLPLTSNHFTGYLGGYVWTGESAVIRAGMQGVAAWFDPSISSHGGGLACGGVLDPQSNQWLARLNLNAGLIAPARTSCAPCWTGEYWLEWGSKGESTGPIAGTAAFANGLGYDPYTDQFLVRPNLTGTHPSLAPRAAHVLVWTGAHMLVWGGFGNWVESLLVNPTWSDGQLYDPVTDMWIAPPGLNGGAFWPGARYFSVSVFTGNEVLVWGGNTGSGTSSLALHNTGAVYVPPRVAPTIRSGFPTGVTQTTWPMGGVPPGGHVVQVGQFWRHRVTVYGCPRSTVTVTGAPGWMVKKDLDTGCFLEGTPGPNDNNQLHSITIVASNGIGNDAIQTFTVYVGTPLPPSQFFTQPATTATAGELYQYTPLAVGTPTPMVVMTVGPSWLTWVGNKLQGKPPYSASGTSVQVRLEAVAQGQSTGAQDFLIHVDYSPYDIDKDKSVDVVDVQSTVNLILSLALPAYPTQGDTNNSGVVDVVDVQAIVNKILAP